VIWLPIVGLVCMLVAVGAGIALVRIRARNAWVFVVACLPGLFLNAYHLWRLWP
jgi:hypothetical protein